MYCRKLVVLALFLNLVGGGLLLRTLQRALQNDPGPNPANMVTMIIGLPTAGRYEQPKNSDRAETFIGASGGINLEDTQMKTTLVLGMAGSFGLAGSMKAMLFGISPFDPLSFVIAAALVGLVA